MSKSHDFPFGIMDVAELLHLRRRRPHSTGAYYDCPFCDDKRGKMSLCADKDVFRCNYCGEHGGMLSLYARMNHISNSEAYREICEALQNGEFATYCEPSTPAPREQVCLEQSPLADIRTIHQDAKQPPKRIIVGFSSLSLARNFSCQRSSKKFHAASTEESAVPSGSPNCIKR